MNICLRIYATVGVQSWTYLNVNNICVNLPSKFESNSSRIFENGLLVSNSVCFSAKYYLQSSHYTSLIKGTYVCDVVC